MPENVPPREKASLKSVVNLAIEAAATRAQIFGLELAVAKENSVKAAINYVIAVLFGLFTLVFASVALLVIYWDDHRVFVSCALAVFYFVLFLFYWGRAKNFSSNLPYAFTESKQVMATDMQTLKDALNKPENTQSNTKESANAGK